MSVATFSFDTPVGKVHLAESMDRLAEISFGKISNISSPTPLLKEAASQIAAYFDGKLKTFDIPYRQDGTQFCKKVWDALEAIPYGERVSYQYIAELLGSPSAARAVGMACGKNSLPLIIPCHRVVAKNGALTGFSSGLSIKKYLLDFEAGVLDYDKAHP